MSREIDLTKPLSDEDRRYLEQRNRYRDIARADGADMRSTPTADTDTLAGSREQSPDARRGTTGEPTQNAAPDAGTNQPDPPDSAAEAGGKDPDEEDNYDDEDSWSYADLQAEAKNRDLSAGGTREDVIARLREDDAADEGEDS